MRIPSRITLQCGSIDASPVNLNVQITRIAIVLVVDGNLVEYRRRESVLRDTDIHLQKFFCKGSSEGGQMERHEKSPTRRSRTKEGAFRQPLLP